MKKCIFCWKNLKENETPEHILISALGGRVTTKNVICAECNNFLGSTCDKKIAEIFVPFRNMLNVQKGRKQSPPTIKKLHTDKGFIDLDPGMVPTLRKKPLEITERENGGWTIRTQVSSIDDLKQYVPNIAAKTGKTIEEVIAAINYSKQQGGIKNQVEKIDSYFKFDFTLDDDCFYRPAAKMMCVLWADYIGNEEFLREEYTDIKGFILGRNSGSSLSAHLSTLSSSLSDSSVA